jgi:hypothetical protein
LYIKQAQAIGSIAENFLRIFPILYITTKIPITIINLDQVFIMDFGTVANQELNMTIVFKTLLSMIIRIQLTYQLNKLLTTTFTTNNLLQVKIYAQKLLMES